MSLTKDEQELQGPDQHLQRRISTAAATTAGAAVFWLIPFVLIFVDDVPRGVFGVLVGLATATSVCSTLLGAAYRSQRIQLETAAQLRQEAADLHEHLIQVIVDHHLVLRREMAGMQADLTEIGNQVKRDYWQIYNDAQVDMSGGKDMVDSAPTRQMNNMSGVKAVVPLTRVNGRL